MSVLNVHPLDVHPLDVHVLGGSCSKCRNKKPSMNEQGWSAKENKISTNNFLGAPASDWKTHLGLSNDVWISPSGAISVGFRTVGSRCIGQKSPLIGDNSVVDHRGSFIGRTFEAGGRTYLDRRCR